MSYQNISEFFKIVDNVADMTLNQIYSRVTTKVDEHKEITHVRRVLENNATTGYTNFYYTHWSNTRCITCAAWSEAEFEALVNS